MTTRQPACSIPLLPECNWFNNAPAVVIPEAVASWLQDKRSTTAKFKQLSRCMQIECCFEGRVARSELGSEAELLPRSVDLVWLREVLMVADGVPWLYGRTLIPRPLLEQAELGLATLGTTPLGERLFNLPVPPQRTEIQVAAVTPPLALVARVATPLRQHWWARRSLLTLQQGSLFVTDLFLPAAPIYQGSHV
jgi:chorismate--pyruvate lyase